MEAWPLTSSSAFISRQRCVEYNDRYVIPLALMVFLLFVVARVKKLKHGLDAVNHLPGPWIPFQPLDFPGSILPTTWWNPGLCWSWKWRFTFSIYHPLRISEVYKKWGADSVSMVPFVKGVPSIFTSNIDVASQVVGGFPTRSSFKKPMSSSQALLSYGMNVGAADGQTWRTHRRIMGPAFNTELYENVWLETVDMYRQMVSDSDWSTSGQMEVPIIQKITFKLAFLLISKCGFGFPATWSTPPKAPDGSMTIVEALRCLHDNYKLIIFTPEWLRALPFPRFRQIREAHKQLKAFMRAEIEERKTVLLSTGQQPAGQDIFTMLVKANEDEDAKFKLTENELIGNVYLMLLTGHETTAHTLAATLTLLAAHQSIQQEVYQHIISVVGHDRDPVIGDYAKLNKVVSVFYEALRMFPSAFVLMREAAEDTILQIPNPPGQEGTAPLAVKKGVNVIVDLIGIQNNPRYFSQPEQYQPSRWYNMSPDSESFIGFSLGARRCIGRKFATTEAVAFLSMLLREWHIEPLLKAGESVEAWQKRVTDAQMIFMLGMRDAPLRFTRRTKEAN
ncbi:cytochrome P450 [Tricholoma matsutake]|nr:cytochrome P450 [Tricholoma matsutake 945]